MPTISINSIEYSSNKGSPIIHVFGRDEKGIARRLDVTGFLPYFYTLSSSSALKALPAGATRDPNQYVSIKGEPCARIFVESPSDVRNIRDKFGTHLEADIVFTTRFLIDAGLKSGVSFDGIYSQDYRNLSPVDVNYPARVCICDIECSDERGWPDSSSDPITCITCHDSFTKTYTTFLLAKNMKEAVADIEQNEPLPNGCFDSDFHAICVYPNESAMLRAFSQYVKAMDPDILTGWNFTGFDMPYILGRFAALHINSELLARLPGKSDKVLIRGRQLFDLLAGYKRMHLTQKESYRLDAIAKEEVGEEKIHFTGKICNLSPSKLIEYNFKDVELCVKINDKDEIVEFHREIAKYVGCPLEKTLNSMPIIDTYILRKAHGRFVLPSKSDMESGEEFEGAVVFPPKKGLHENVVVLDLTSLYPMIMMTGNMSPDTKDPKGELVTPLGIRFRKSPDGIVREIQSEFFKERADAKKKRNSFKFGSRDYKLMDMKQNVIKILMNSYYGVSGNSRFRLHDREIAASITATGQKILEHNKKLIEEEGYEIITGDSVGKDSKISLYTMCGEFDSHTEISKVFDRFSVLGNWVKNNKEYCLPIDMYTDTIDKNGNPVLRPVKYIMRHKVQKKMYRVNITNTWHVDVTEDHSLIGYLNKSKEKYLGNRLVEVKPNDLGKKIKSVVVKQWSAREKESLDNGFPKEAYELMGYFVGCGSFESKSTRCCLAGGNDYKEIIEKIFIPLEKRGMLQWKIKSEKKGDIAFYGELNELFHNTLRGKGIKKIIPKFIFSESVENQCSFLRGLFSSDGTCMVRPSGPLVRYCSIDVKLCEKIQSLLHMVGISSSIFRDNTPNSYKGIVSGTHSYLCSIKSLEQFAEHIGFIEERKHSRVSGYKTKLKKELFGFDICKIKSVEEIFYDDYVYDIEVEGTHRFFANNILVHNTDSCLTPIPEELGQEKTIEIARSLEKKLNDSYPAFAKKVLNADHSYFSVKFEKLYSRFFSGGRKKRYAGLLVWKEGKDVHEIDIVGFETKRSDTPAVTKKAQKLLMEMVLEGRDYEEIKREIREIVRKYRAGEYPLDEIGIPGGIGKALSEYERPDAQIRGAKYANEYMGGNFGKGSKPKRIYVKAVPPGYPRTDVICFEYGDQVPEGFVVDLETMQEKTLEKPLSRILDALDWNWAEFNTGMTTLGKWGLG